MSNRKTYVEPESESWLRANWILVALLVVGLLFAGFIVRVVTSPTPDLPSSGGGASSPASPARASEPDPPASLAPNENCGPGEVRVNGYYREGRYVRGYCRSQ